MGLLSTESQPSSLSGKQILQQPFKQPLYSQELPCQPPRPRLLNSSPASLGQGESSSKTDLILHPAT